MLRSEVRDPIPDSTARSTARPAKEWTADRLQAHWRDRRCIIVDLDGTLIRGRDLIPGAAALLDLFDGRWVVVSNNSTHSARRLAGQLAKAGLAVPPERLVLAGMLAIETLAREHAGASVMLFGSRDLVDAADAAGIHLVRSHADLVLLARDERFSYARLARIVDEVARGAGLVVTNRDRSHPGHDGRAVPETGSLLQAVLACVTPRSLQVIGKPEPAPFAEALRRLAADPWQCLVIGDNPETDVAGAERLGMPSLLVGRPPFDDAAALCRMIREPGRDAP
jgi:HAD superfamily hydrolase (TIGR01450 family)